jgi:hypothetical protein
MYFPDLTPYTYLTEAAQPVLENALPVVNIGWLDDRHIYSQGDAPPDFIARLWAFCASPVNNTRGFHECPFCDVEPSKYLMVQQGNEEIGMGSGEIWIFGSNALTYAAPSLIYHYIVNHHYMPPEEFIQATLDAPLPGTSEYGECAGRYMWGKVMLRNKKYDLS